MGTTLSNSFRLRRGVPQGSVLGPFLFLVYINSIASRLASIPSLHFSLFADDLAIWASSSSVTEATTVVQRALDVIADWSTQWIMPLNVGKCTSTLFSMDPRQANLQPTLHLCGSPLAFCPTPTFLGVTLDRTLSFHPHVSRLRAKAFPRLLALKSISSLSWGPSMESLSLIYCAFILSLLLYACPSWYPYCSKSTVTVLLRLHSYACRIITE